MMDKDGLSLVDLLIHLAVIVCTAALIFLFLVLHLGWLISVLLGCALGTPLVFGGLMFLMFLNRVYDQCKKRQ